MSDADPAAARAPRRIALGALAWLAGSALVMACAELPPRTASAAGVALALALLASGWLGRARPGFLADVRLAAGLLLLAASLAAWQGRQRIDERLAPSLEGIDLVVIGVVAGLPLAGNQGQRFRFEPESARRARGNAAPVALPSLLSLAWNEAWTGGAAQACGDGPRAGELRAGQRWRFTLRLRRPHGTLNPHAHDVELTWFEQGIGALGHVRAGPVPPACLGAAVAHPVDRLRQRVRDDIFARVDDRRAAGLLAALAIGDQSAIGADDWALFRDTGIAHLVSISGLHVTMFAWAAGGLIAAVWRRHPSAPLRLATPHAARWGGLGTAVGYAVVAGWGVPAQRTALMLAAVALLTSLGLRWPWMLVLLVAAALVTALDAWALLQPGFWLSFVAVGLLMVSDGGRARSRPAAATGEPPRRLARLGTAAWLHLRQGAHGQWVATLGLAPLGLVFFGQLSLVGLLANGVAIPLVTLALTPLALLGVAWPLAWQLAALLAQALSAFLQALAHWPQAVWTAAAAPAWAQAAGLLAALVAVLPWSWRLRCLALPLGLPLLLPPIERPPHGHLEVVAADVGQGSAVLVRTRGHLLLYDAGPAWGRDSDAGQRVLLPLLRGRGERRIDLLVLSHRDSDHTGGASSLLRALPVAAVAGSLEADHPLRTGPAPYRACRAGDRWSWDGVEFAVLHPPDDGADPAVQATAGRAGRPPSSNARSCVLRVSGRGGSLLLTGDIERAQELALVARAGVGLRADVLLLPHHGSRSSSSAAFLDAVAPRLALAQAGYRNRFGHPAPEVLARHAERGVPVVATPGCGAWSWRDDRPLEQAQCERQRRRRHWHDTPSPRRRPLSRGQRRRARRRASSRHRG